MAQSKAFTDASHALNDLSHALALLEAENAKLRQELQDVHSIFWHGCDCTECPWFDECDHEDGCSYLGILSDHMRKLGVEVSG